MKIFHWIVIFLGGLVFLVWLGLKIQPASFTDYPPAAQDPSFFPLPDNLPAPVARYYLEIYGKHLPLISSAVITGKASMRVNGITFPARFRFTHLAGKGYRHYIEATFYGIPIMKVNEFYLDGHGLMELPFGTFESPQVDQGANLGMWAESVWLPSIFLSDPRVRWEAMDDESAILVVPFGDDEQRFITRFDPDTGLLQLMETMRFRDADGGKKILWITENLRWELLDNTFFPIIGSATWLDEGQPWAVFSVEDIKYNVPVDEYIKDYGE